MTLPTTAPARRFRSEPRAWRKYLVIGALCAGQSFPFAFTSSVMPTVARANGLPTDAFWLLSIALVPYWAKVLWAFLVDRHGSQRWGRRRSWIIPCTLLATCGLFALGYVPPQPGLFFASFALLALVIVMTTTQDVAVDAYCIESLHRHDFSLGTTVKMLCEAIGSALAAWGLLALYQDSDWRTTTSFAACALILFTGAILIRPERPQPFGSAEGACPQRRASLGAFFARAHLVPMASILFAAGFLNASLLSVWGPFLIDQKMSVTQVGMLLGGAAFVGEITAAVVANWLHARWGVRRVFAAIAFGCSPLLLPAAWVAHRGPSAFAFHVVCVVLLAFVFNALHALMTIHRMQWSRGTQVATDFTGFGLFYNLGRTAGPIVAGAAVAAAGWSLYIAAVAVAVGVFGWTCHLVLHRYEIRFDNEPATTSSAAAGI
jgi:MFS transporter, PAT family, beta-lactamase induction signal transducer AmpG